MKLRLMFVTLLGAVALNVFAAYPDKSDTQQTH